MKIEIEKATAIKRPKLGKFTNHTHPFVKFMWEDIIRRDLKLASVSRASGIDTSSLHKWRVSGRGPFISHLENVLEVLGYRLVIVKINK